MDWTYEPEFDWLLNGKMCYKWRSGNWRIVYHEVHECYGQAYSVSWVDDDSAIGCAALATLEDAKRYCERN